MKTISVMPANGGWRVASDTIDNDLMFRRGRSAEHAAMRLAEAAAAIGELIRVEIHIADGSIARRFVCPAKPPLASDVEWAACESVMGPAPMAGPLVGSMP